MKLMFPANFRVVAILLAITVVLSVSGIAAQTKKQAAKKPAATKKAASKKETAKAKDSRKDKKTKKETVADKRNAKKKEDAKSRSTAKTDKKADKKKNSAESKRAETERRRKEAERRAAALAEQRRREQARREAIARQQAFIRGLRTETVDNIAKDRTDGEDLAIRNVALNALGDQAGSVVVMEAQTGKVLTVVNQEWAVRRTIRPCSTIKLVTAAAGLNEGVIDKQTGAVKSMSTRRMLDDALAYSDNPYFQRVGANLGNAKLVEYGRQFGLGEPTGINLENESPGRLPVNNSNARIYSHGDDTEVSTIQLAVMASAMTNGGHRVLPRIPRSAEQNSRFQTFYKANVELPQQNVRRVIPGMMGAAEYGTARRGMDQTLGVAGKTGSCIDKGTWVGLFTSVAPIEQPKYAVAVILRGPKQRGRYAAAVASRIYSALAPNIVRTDRNLARTEFNIQPRNAVPTTVAAADDDEDEDENAESTETNLPAVTSGVILVPSAPRQTESKKLVQKTVDSKSTFPPVVITYSKDGKTSTITSQPDNKKRERVVKP